MKFLLKLCTLQHLKNIYSQHYNLENQCQKLLEWGLFCQANVVMSLTRNASLIPHILPRKLCLDRTYYTKLQYEYKLHNVIVHVQVRENFWRVFLSWFMQEF